MDIGRRNTMKEQNMSKEYTRLYNKMRKILDPGNIKTKTTDLEIEKAARLGIVNISPYRTVKLVNIYKEFQPWINPVFLTWCDGKILGEQRSVDRFADCDCWVYQKCDQADVMVSGLDYDSDCVCDWLYPGDTSWTNCTVNFITYSASIADTSTGTNPVFPVSLKSRWTNTP